MLAINVCDRNAPGVFDILVDRHSILRAGEHLTECSHPERRCIRRLANHLLQFRAESRHRMQMCWNHSFLHCSLNAVPAQELRMLFTDVPEFWNVDPIVSAVIIGICLLYTSAAADERSSVDPG